MLLIILRLLAPALLLVVGGIAEGQQQDGEKSLPCNACPDGTINESLDILGIPCSDWLAEAVHVDPEWEECTLHRAIGVQFCGCGTDEAFEICFLCGNDATSNQNVNLTKPIPDSPISSLMHDETGTQNRQVNTDSHPLTCGDIMELPDVDSGVTCELLKDKYAWWCGCPNVQAPSCPFCEDGGEPNLDLPYPFPLGSGLPTDPSCRGAHDATVVQSSARCEEYRDNVLRSGAVYMIDMYFYCQCPGVEPPDVCQGSYCPEGTAIPDDRLDTLSENGWGGMTCGMLNMAWDLNAKPRSCEIIARTVSDCCVASDPSSGVPGMGGAILVVRLLLLLFFQRFWSWL